MAVVVELVDVGLFKYTVVYPFMFHMSMAVTDKPPVTGARYATRDN